MASFGYDGYRRHQYAGSPIRDSFFVRSRKLRKFLLSGSLFRGAAAAGLEYTSCFIQRIAGTVPFAAVMFLIVFSVSAMNRKTGEAKDALNDKSRFPVTKKFERHLMTFVPFF
jgi:hypothetical protein